MKPKFYTNTDNNHCLQCCVRMVHNSINQESINSEEIDLIIKYDSNLWTWTIAGSRFLSQKLEGVKIVNGGFDYRKFVTEGRDYLKKTWSEKRLFSQQSHSSAKFKKEINNSRKFLESGGTYQKYNLNNTQSLQNILKSNFLIAQVDHGKLYNEKYNGVSHYILVYSQLNNYLIIHDPGLPQRESYSIKTQRFISAYSNESIIIPKPVWWDSNLELQRNKPCPCNSGLKNKKCHNL